MYKYNVDCQDVTERWDTLQYDLITDAPIWETDTARDALECALDLFAEQCELCNALGGAAYELEGATYEYDYERYLDIDGAAVMVHTVDGRKLLVRAVKMSDD